MRAPTARNITPSNIVVIGSGVVGQATGIGFHSFGHNVTFSDINEAVLQKLRERGFKTCHESELRKSPDSTVFSLSICTPTKRRKIVLTYLERATKTLGRALKTVGGYPLVVVRSTLPPGTTKRTVVRILEESSGKKAGVDFGVTMNPEFLREDRNEQDFQNPWIIVIGRHNEESGNALQSIYGEQSCPIEIVSLDEAEAIKYIHNLYNAHKTGFFNECREVLERIGIDPNNVFPVVVESAEASFNHEYGIRNWGAWGGNCLIKDTEAFLHFAYRCGVKMPILKANIESNRALAKKLEREKEGVDFSPEEEKVAMVS